MSESPEQLIVFEDVSKFYGEILGVNRVNLTDRARASRALSDRTAPARRR